MAARNRPLTLVCHPSPAERSAATTSLSSRKVTWVLFWPRGRPRPRVTASMMCGMASRAGRAVRNSAAVSGESSAREGLVLAGRDRFIGPRFSAVGAAKVDQSHAVHPVGKDHRVQAVARPSNRGLTSLAVGSTGPTASDVAQSKSKALSKDMPCLARLRAALVASQASTD